MQILIKFKTINDTNVSIEKQLEHIGEWMDFYSLLKLLERDGYRINTLYGRFVFDHKNKEVIDVGKPGAIIPASMEMAKSIYETNGKFAIIFTDKKYIVFGNRYFILQQFCHMRKVRPLSISQVIDNYRELVLNESKELLNKLYEDRFEQKF